MEKYFEADLHKIILFTAGVIALLAAVVPVLLKRKYISAPIVYLAVGAVGYWISGAVFNPIDNLPVIEYVTEFVVLVALVNSGLRIKAPFKWHTWRYAFRLLIVTMPLTIVAAAFLGWWILGFAPAAAMLFGAIISPTDPVLASGLQTSEPGEEDSSKSKLGLTAEAGINDGLAFPFTYFAIRAASEGTDMSGWLSSWALHDLLARLALGTVVGLLCGWGLYKLVFNISAEKDIKRISRGILSVALILLPYAIAEYVGGYGFIAAFFAACMFSNFEEHQEHMTSLHDFNEELEAFAVGLIFLTTGVFITLHYRIFYDWQILTVAFSLILLVRPLAGYLALAGTGLNHFQKFVLAFYGIRGVGSLYYLSFALAAAQFADAEKLFAVTTATIFFSVIIHGVTTGMIRKKMKHYDNTGQ